MNQELIKQAKNSFEESLRHLEEEFSRIRTSRAQASLIEDITFDYYGARTRVKEAATISVTPPNLLVIQPWDKTALEGIAKAISSSGVELAPIVDGEIIRITFPSLTEERRKELQKLVHEKTEETRISIRNRREEAQKALRAVEEKGSISEDETFRTKSELQRLVDEYNTKTRELENKKEKEIMTV